MEKPCSSSESKQICVSNWKEKSLDLLESILPENEVSAGTESSADLLKEKEIIEKKMKSESEELKAIQKELEKLENENVDLNKYKLQFYQLITRITWDLEKLPGEISGYISKPFTVFNLNAETNSKYSISKHLWDLIGSEKQEESSKDSS